MTTQTSSPTEAWLAKLRDLAPLIEQYRDESESTRRLPKPLFQAMYDAGLYRIMLTRAFGGAQLSMSACTQVIEAVARHDGAVGWNLFIGLAGGLFADYLAEEAAREVFAAGVVGGSFTPGGTAEAVEGGYRISGKWPFASGCHNTAWLSGACAIIRDGQPVLGPTGEPEMILPFARAEECEILDTWYTAGLRGTGSNHFQAKDVFVPEGRTFSFAQLFRGPVARESTGYTAGFFPLQGPLMAAVSLGIARDALESFKELALAKTPRRATTTLAQQATAQETLGRAEALVNAARAYVYDEAARHDALVNPTPEQSMEAGMLLRLAAVHAAHQCSEAVDMLFEAGGGSSIYTSSRLERCFRDVHVVTHHQQLTPAAFDQIGAFLADKSYAAAPELSGSWLAKMEAIGPAIEQYRVESEAERHMPAPLFQLMRDAGCFRLSQPRIFGGEQLSSEVATHVIEAISAHDGAAGWNTMISAHMGLLADQLPDDGAAEVFSPELQVCAGNFSPRGSAVAVEGGYRVSGRWPFASGSANANWFVVAAMVTNEGEQPAPRFFFLPSSEGTIIDTWHTTGLRGTGSNDIEVSDVFVPARRSFPGASFIAGPPESPRRAYARPLFDEGSPHMAGISLGIARDAIETFKDIARGKTPARGTQILGVQATTHRRIAKGEALLRCARAATYEAARSLAAPPSTDPAVRAEHSASIRSACALACEMCTKAVDIMYEAGGASSIYETSRLERDFRDVHMVTHHVLMSQTNFEMVGQFYLGGELLQRR